MYLTYKNIGETPLECLERVRLEYGKAPEVPMTYAGRLDPMAEGLLLVLSGKELQNKDKYLGLPKTYEFEVLEFTLLPIKVFEDVWDRIPYEYCPVVVTLLLVMLFRSELELRKIP